MSWTDKYQVVNVAPGRVVTKKNGEVDLSDKTLPVALIDQIYESGSAYLRLRKPAKVAAKLTDEASSL